MLRAVLLSICWRLLLRAHGSQAVLAKAGSAAQFDVGNEGMLSESVADRLWGGEDLVDEEVTALGMRMQKERLSMPDLEGASGQKPLAKHTEQHARVVGLFGTGTSLMSEMMKQYFGERVLTPSGYCKENSGRGTSGQIQCPAIQCNATSCSSGFWKHTHPLRLEDFDGTRPVTLIAMIRNPMAMLGSWHHPPKFESCQGQIRFMEDFDLEELEPCRCQSCDASDRDHPCASPESEFWSCDEVGGEHAAHLGGNFAKASAQPGPAGAPREEYENVVDLWNSYLRGYERLKEEKPGNIRVHIVRYEDLVQFPEQVLRGVAVALGLGAVTDAELLRASGHRRYDFLTRKREAHVDKIRARSYRKRFLERHYQMLMGAVSRDLVTKFGYLEIYDPASQPSRHSS